jgi:hypothetical protein
MAVSPVGLGINGHCAGECQQQFRSQITSQMGVEWRSSQSAPLAEKKAPLLNAYMSRREQTSWSQIPPVLETKNFCAGEGQRQFNRQTDCTVILGSESFGTHDHILLSHDSRSHDSLGFSLSFVRTE